MRHHLGIYRCIVVSAHYQPPANLSPVDVRTRLTSAVAAVVEQQPILRVGILDQDTSNASFCHVPSIDLRNHIEYREEAGDDKVLSDTHSGLHDQLFEDIESRPPWRIVVLPTARGLHVILAIHHSLADALSAKLFHQHVLAALRSSQETKGPLLTFPNETETQLPEPQEKAVPFTKSYGFLARTIFSLLAPSFLQKFFKDPVPWAAAPVSFAIPYKTPVRLITLAPDGDAVSRLVAASRAHSTTLTGLIHGLIMASMSRRLPSASSFTCSTPINLAPWRSVPTNDKLCLTITALDTPLPIPRPCPDNDEAVWSTARRIKTHLADRLATLPADDQVSLLPLVSDYADFWKSKDGKERDATWELSNIGALTPPDATEADSPWSVTSAVFTSGAMVAGPPLGFNTMSVRDGPLIVGLTWQDTVVDAELAEGVASDLEDMAAKWLASGHF